jgi:hypothetical protein
MRPIRHRSRSNRPAYFAPALAGLTLPFDLIVLRARADLSAVSVDVDGRRLAY